jgi:hypothetical protein
VFDEQKEIFILTGSIQEYEGFVRLNGLDKMHTHYLIDKNQLRGRTLFPGQILKIGAWYLKDSKIIDEIDIMINYNFNKYYHKKKI